jgi:hypothetical protein
MRGPEICAAGGVAPTQKQNKDASLPFRLGALGVLGV